eukprot:COSAG05_NODE_15845_length_359_cov_1.200000_1_plen_89_part_10
MVVTTIDRKRSPSPARGRDQTPATSHSTGWQPRVSIVWSVLAVSCAVAVQLRDEATVLAHPHPAAPLHGRILTVNHTLAVLRRAAQHGG